MTISSRERRLLRIAGWLIVAIAWAVFIGLGWRNGQLGTREFAWDAGRNAFITLFAAASQLHQTWRARQPKPPPVYRSTILD
jgi:hypothetical protein